MTRALLAALALALAVTGCLAVPSKTPPCEVQRVDELYLGAEDAAVDHEPWLSPDHLELIFRREYLGGDNLVVARRDSVEKAFGPVQVLDADFAATATAPFVTDDGLDIWYVAYDAMSGVPSVYTAHRAARDQRFGESSLVPLTTTRLGDGLIADVSLTSDQRTIIAGTTQDNIYAATRAPGGPFPPLDVVSFSAGAEGHPSISGDGTVVYYFAYLATVPTIFSVARDPDAMTYGQPAQVFAISAALLATSDESPQLDRDGRTVAFSSDRGDTSSQIFLYCE